MTGLRDKIKEICREEPNMARHILWTDTGYLDELQRRLSGNPHKADIREECRFISNEWLEEVGIFDGDEMENVIR